MKSLLIAAALAAAFLLLPGCQGGDNSGAAGEESGDSAGSETEAGSESEEGFQRFDEEYSEESVSSDVSGLLEYAIITNEEMKASFQKLADWKSLKGVPTRVITVDEALEGQDGRDDAEKARNFLIALRKEHPLTYVLMGGDAPLVPHREFFCEADVFGEYDTSGIIASDLYFADLDGTWNDDDDLIWGEFEDNLDMTPELHVGRAGVDNADEALVFVDKIIAYEQNPPQDFIETALFLTEDTGYGMDGAMGLDSISSSIFPERFKIKKLYEDPTGYPDAKPNTRESSFDEYQRGPNFYVHFGHGGGTDVGLLPIEDVDSLTNAPRCGVFVTTACFSGGFHSEDRSGGEAFTAHPNGGGVTYVGNTELGLGFPSGMVYIHKFFEIFFHYARPISKLGPLYDQARMEFSDMERLHKDKHPDRWTVLSQVLFGDPEMDIWSAEPQPLTIKEIDKLHLGRNVYKVEARGAGGPLSGASATIRLPGGALYISETDESGRAEFRFNYDGGEAFLSIVKSGRRPAVIQIGNALKDE